MREELGRELEHAHWLRWKEQKTRDFVMRRRYSAEDRVEGKVRERGENLRNDETGIDLKFHLKTQESQNSSGEQNGGSRVLSQHMKIGRASGRERVWR